MGSDPWALYLTLDCKCHDGGSLFTTIDHHGYSSAHLACSVAGYVRDNRSTRIKAPPTDQPKSYLKMALPFVLDPVDLIGWKTVLRV